MIVIHKEIKTKVKIEKRNHRYFHSTLFLNLLKNHGEIESTY